MSAREQLVVVLCTVPDEAAAERLARGLVEERLAACLKSFYRWQGNIEAQGEIQLLIKTHADRFDELAAWLQQGHPYDVPEIIALPAERVSDGYLAWAIEQTTKRGR